MNIGDLGYYEHIGQRSKLVYSEAAVRMVNGLVIPAYRLSDANGQWPAIGPKPKSVHAFNLIQKISRLAEEGQSKKIPALSHEEEALAETLLALLAYAGGRNIDIGRAMMLVHHKACGEN